MSKIKQIDKYQEPHSAAINRAAFALGVQAKEVRQAVERELQTRTLGQSQAGKWYVKELTKMGGY